MNAFLIAGTSSGVGKTTITLSFISYFKKIGLNVQPFKVGPDFIDPGYHKIFSNNESINLDGWMLTKNYNIDNFNRHSYDKDISIVEGVMGLFDGFSSINDSGSSAEIAKWLQIPIILIVDAKSMARSVAAIVYGFENFDRDLRIAGVIFNNVSSNSHYSYLKESVEKYCASKVLGFFKKGDFPTIPSRHLGLVIAEENENFINYKDELANVIEKRINVEYLLKITKFSPKKISYFQPCNKKVKIAVAKDKAFCFYYYDNLKLLEKFGGEIVYFSPLKDKFLPENIDAIYFGGGYPEIFAEELSRNITMLKEIKDFSNSHGIIYAECGGFIYLTKGVYDFNGKFFPLVGIFDDSVIMEKKLRALGYAEVTLQSDSFLGKKGSIIKGHEFHYSYLKDNGRNLNKIYKVRMRKNIEGKLEGYIWQNTIGSYIHLHFGSNENIVKNLIYSIKGG